MRRAANLPSPVTNDRREQRRKAPGFASRKGEKLVDGLTKAELVRKYEPAVRMIAAALSAKIGQTSDVEDLVSVGLIGLMNAAERYDAKKGARFLTYAEIRIRGAMLDELRRQDFVPSCARRRMKQMEAASEDIEKKTGRRATDEELRSSMGVSEKRLRNYQRNFGKLTLVHYQDLSELECGAEGSAVRDSLSEARPANDPFTETSRKDSRAWLEELFKTLPEDSRLVLSCYYFRGLQVQEIAAILGVTKSRISQIHSDAILRLKRTLLKRNHDLRSMFEMLLTA